MRLTYGLLELVGIKKRGGKLYAHLGQRVTCNFDSSKEILTLFGFTENCTSYREVYYRIPVSSTQEHISLLLQSYPLARIIRVIDNEPVLSLKQREDINAGVVSLSDVAATQIVRNDKGWSYIDIFGLAVFGQNRLNLSGDQIDQDYRKFALTGTEIAADTHETALIEEIIKHKEHEQARKVKKH